MSLQKWFFTVLKNKKRPTGKVVGQSGRAAQPPCRQWINAPQPLLGLNRADDLSPPSGFCKTASKCQHRFRPARAGGAWGCHLVASMGHPPSLPSPSISHRALLPGEFRVIGEWVPRRIKKAHFWPMFLVRIEGAGREEGSSITR